MTSVEKFDGSNLIYDLQAKDIIARNRIFNTIGDVLPSQSQKPIVKLYKTVLTEEYKRYLKFHSSKEKQTDFIFSGGLKSVHDMRELENMKQSQSLTENL